MSGVDTAASPMAAKPFYTRIAIAGLVFFALGFIVYLALALSQGGTEGAAFFAIFPTLALVFAGLAWKLGGRALIAVAVFALLNLAINGLFLADPLISVGSFFDFFLALIVIVGLLLALVGAVVAYVQYRRGTARAMATVGEARLFAAVAAAVLALGVLSAVLDFTGRPVVSAEARTGASVMVMRAVRFEPDVFTVSAGDTVRVLVKNQDFTRHTFTIEALGIDADLHGRAEAIVELPEIAPGTYDYVCTIPGHEKMTGKLVVVDSREVVNSRE